MKIDQLKELNDSITKKQLRQLVNENENNINEFIRLQKYFKEGKINITKKYHNRFTEFMYKISTNGYAHTVNLVIDKLQNKDCDTLDNISPIIARIAADIDKGIVYANEFIDNLIDCTIENKESYLSLFDIYNEALGEEILKEKIIEILSNKKFVTNRMGRVRSFIRILTTAVAFDIEAIAKGTLSNNIALLIKVILSDELLDTRSIEEHEYIARFFKVYVKKQHSHDMFELSTSSQIVSNRNFDEQLYLLNLYNELVISNEDAHKILKSLFLNKKIYTKLSFNFQMYLIEIVRKIHESNEFIDALDTLLNSKNLELEFEVKELIKKYTDCAKSVEEIINDSFDCAEAIKTIASEAQRENITEFNSDTKLVLVPYHHVSAYVDNLKKYLNHGK